MWANILIGILLTTQVVVCVLLVFIILMQRSKQEGLGAAFGGGMTDSMFGAQTSNVLTKGTVWLTVFFFAISISLAYLHAHRQPASSLQDKLTKEAAAVAPAKPLTPTPTSPAGTVAEPAATPAPVATPAVPATPAPPVKSEKK
jgi:preprotein translocase subunit SecG